MLKKKYSAKIAAFKTMCIDLPDIVCQSCDMLEHANDMRVPKDSWTNINNSSWIRLKEKLNIQNFNKKISKYAITAPNFIIKIKFHQGQN